ncbi:extra-cytoplasmic solute receptor [Cupriavidus necator N-1]|jgi:tripartite-type tricarboxylate transporter receptor subunit TctC|uniref:Extra-cytoplasmic solute receptor n=1 Tax=Cupriavidus necator (strain ATCC 43291 / DSM 13513 / CCUG 52238 / LMG 8453 / N-1) TaxID=1042878 RepID=G0ETX5_CUPNN|nr:tripartite tricarboxylate transporter substrate binding protein [Cupriavidus necator]AEI75640.1 extra-cytoplasmic solute receptor [Cupriavidus necator N-1]MDX6012217.1 tripartite tricarboxylate transporter substrate binding protein [Cupriavidus necator]
MNRRAWLALAAGGLIGGFSLSLALPAAAQTYPAKPIRIVVPYVAGGGTDTIARAMGEKLSKRLGQPVVVDNKAGASGIIGTDAVAKAAPDGYTLLMTLTQSVLTNQFLYQKLPYDPRKDLTMISVLADAQLVLVAHPSVPARTVRELGEYARSRPGKLSYASWGVGSLSHLSGAYYSKLVHGQATHVPYKGEAPMMQDLLGGQVQFGFASILTAKPYIQSGKLKALAVTGTQRSSALPDMPTFAESGMQDSAFKTVGWIGLVAPVGVPAPILARLEGEVRAILQAPDMQERLVALGLRTVGSSPAEAQALYARDWPVLKTLVADSGAKLD